MKMRSQQLTTDAADYCTRVIGVIRVIRVIPCVCLAFFVLFFSYLLVCICDFILCVLNFLYFF